MTLARVFYTAVFLPGLIACDQPPQGTKASVEAPVFNRSSYSQCPSLYDQISNQPEEDARTGFRRGDLRVLALLEPGFLAPGLSEELSLSIANRGPSAYRTFEGLEDHVDENTCLQFKNFDAAEYMERYNRELIRLMQGARQ